MIAEPPTTSIDVLKAKDCPAGASYHSIHNHDLFQTVEEKNTNPALRDLDEKQRETAQMLSKAGLSSVAIYSYLYSECKETNTPVTFTKADIYNQFNRGHSVLDCSNVLKYLHSRYVDNRYLPYDVDMSADGIMDRLFFVLGDGMKTFGTSDTRIIIYDTKHGTNRYGFKIGMFVTVDGNGCTEVLAGSVIRSEDEESFSWVFNCFIRYFRDSPKIVFTDSDGAMAAAISSTWANTTHLLCSFHLWKNFYEHIHPLFTGDHENWKEVSSMWWFLAKQTDMSCKYMFDSCFAVLVNFVEIHGKTSDENKNKQLKWLDGLKHKKTNGLHAIPGVTVL